MFRYLGRRVGSSPGRRGGRSNTTSVGWTQPILGATAHHVHHHHYAIYLCHQHHRHFLQATTHLHCHLRHRSGYTTIICITTSTNTISITTSIHITIIIATITVISATTITTEGFYCTSAYCSYTGTCTVYSHSVHFPRSGSSGYSLGRFMK